jgi:OmpA-OmpF porin, OOP family
MKKAILSAFFLLSFLANAQKENSNVENDTIKKPYKTWSVELSAGQNKALQPFTPNYYQSGNTNHFNFSTVNSFNVGVRKMFNPKFGLKLNFAYNSFTNGPSTSSLPFETKSLRASLEAVLNLGRILEFESFSKRLGLLAHSGIQVSDFTPNKDTKFFHTDAEDNGGLIFGITPQFRIVNWLAITADISYIFNVRQHYTWDGQSNSLDPINNSNNRFNLSGSMVETTMGLTFYLGKKEKHADWYNTNQEVAKEDKNARKRLDKIETLMNDTDKDGIADYLDQENNTPAGVTVDSRGKYIDLNRNGVPDELERKSTDEPSKEAVATNQDALQSLVESGYVNVFFDVNKDNPNMGSTNNVYQIIEYLRTHPQAKATLKGYADVRGDEAKNLDLSKRRAQNVFDIISASGIEASRITIAGEGVDASYPNTKTGLDLARRVSVSINK